MNLRFFVCAFLILSFLSTSIGRTKAELNDELRDNFGLDGSLVKTFQQLSANTTELVLAQGKLKGYIVKTTEFVRKDGELLDREVTRTSLILTGKFASEISFEDFNDPSLTPNVPKESFISNLLSQQPFQEFALTFGTSRAVLKLADFPFIKGTEIERFAKDGEFVVEPGLHFFAGIEMIQSPLASIATLLMGKDIIGEQFLLRGYISNQFLFRLLTKIKKIKEKLGDAIAANLYTPPAEYLAFERERTLFDFELTLPSITPIPFGSLNDKSKLHIVNEETRLRILAKEDNSITFGAAGLSNIWLLNQALQIETAFDIRMQGINLQRINVAGSVATNLSNLGLTIPGFQVNRVFYEGELSLPRNFKSTQDSQSKVDLGLGLGLEVQMFDQQPVNAKVGVNLKDAKLDEISLALSSADSNGFQLKNLPVIKDVPVINELETGPLVLGLRPGKGDFYFSSSANWASKGIQGQLAVMLLGGKPVVLLRSNSFSARSLIPELPTVIDELPFPDTVLSFSVADLSGFFSNDFPEGVRDILVGISEDSGSPIPLTDGITLLSAFKVDQLPNLLRDALGAMHLDASGLRGMGLNGPLVLSGSIEGVFQGKPGIRVAALLPAIKFPDAFHDADGLGRVVGFKQAQGSLYIEAKAASQSVEVGISGGLSVSMPNLRDSTKVDEIDLLGSLFGRVDVTGSLVLGVKGQMVGILNEPLGLEGTRFGNLALQIGVDVAGALDYSMAGDFGYTTIKGETRDFSAAFAFNVLISTKIPLPKKVAISLKGNEINPAIHIELTDLFIRNVANNPLISDQVLDLFPNSNEKELFQKVRDEFKKISLVEMLNATEDLPMDAIKIKDFEFNFSTPGVEIAGRKDLSKGVGGNIEGRFVIVLEGKEHLIADGKLAVNLSEGFRLTGSLGDIEVGPVELKDSLLDVKLGIPVLHGIGNDKFQIRGKSKILSFESDLDMNLSLKKFYARFESKWGVFGETKFFLEDARLDNSVAPSEQEGSFVPKDFYLSASLANFDKDKLKEQVLIETRKILGIAKKEKDKADDAHSSAREKMEELNSEQKSNAKELKGKEGDESYFKREVRKLEEQRDQEIDSKNDQLKKAERDMQTARKIIFKLNRLNKSQSKVYWEYLTEEERIFFLGFLKKIGEDIVNTVKRGFDKAKDFAEKAFNAARNVFNKLKREIEIATANFSRWIGDVKKNLDRVVQAIKTIKDRIAAVGRRIVNIAIKVTELARVAARKVAEVIRLDQIINTLIDLVNPFDFKINHLSLRRFSIKNALKNTHPVIVDVDISFLGKRIVTAVELNVLHPAEFFPNIIGLFIKIVKDGAKAASQQSIASLAPPQNNDFLSALPVDWSTNSLLTSLAGSNREDQEPRHFDQEHEHSVWYKITTDAAGGIELNSFGSAYDANISVYSGTTLTNLVEIASNDDHFVNQTTSSYSQVRFSAKENTEYHVSISGNPATTPLVKLQYQRVMLQAPVNDNFSKAIALAGNEGSVSANIIDSTVEENEPQHGGLNPRHTVWYSWQPTQSLKADLNTSGSGFDTLLSVYQGERLENLQVVIEGKDNLEKQESRVVFDAIANQKYLIAVSAVDTGTQLKLNYGMHSHAEPQNNLRENAILVSGKVGKFIGTNVGAYNQFGESIDGENSVWWKWTGSGNAGEFAQLDTQGSEIDTHLQVYLEDADGNLQFVTSNDDDPDNPLDLSSKVQFPIISEQTYFFRVSSFLGMSGPIHLSLETLERDLDLSNDMFSNAKELDKSKGKLVSNASYSTIEAGEPLNDDAFGSLWWKWSPLQNQVMNISVVLKSGEYEGLEIFQGETVANLELIASGPASKAGKLSIQFAGQAGKTYYIRLEESIGIDQPLFLNWSTDDVSTPSNDHFDSAQALTGTEGNVSSNNFLATGQSSEESDHNESADASLWYEFSPQQAGFYQFDFSADFAAAVRFYQGSVMSNLDVELDLDLESNSNETQFNAQSTFYLEASDRYYIQVDGNGESRGNFDINYKLVDAQSPSNDSHDTPLLIQANQWIEGDNTYTRKEANELEFATFDAERSLWYQFNATQDLVMTAQLISDDAMVLVIYESNNGTLKRLTVADSEFIFGSTNFDDSQALVSTTTNSSLLAVGGFSAKAGASYIIGVASRTDEISTFRLKVQSLKIEAAANDNSESPTVISTLPFEISSHNFGSTHQTGETTIGHIDGGSSVWYQLVAPQSGFIELSLDGRDLEATLAVFNLSNPEQPVLVDYSEDRSLIVTITQGGDYRFMVDGHYGGQGHFTLKGKIFDYSSPGNDSFSSAISLNGRGDHTEFALDLASIESGETQHFNLSSLRESIWYSTTTSFSGLMKLVYRDNFNGGVAVYTGSNISNLQLVAGVAPSTGLRDQQIEDTLEFIVSRNETYYICVFADLDNVFKDLGKRGSIRLSSQVKEIKANAGEDQTVREGQKVFLVARTETGFFANNLSYKWSPLTTATPIVIFNESQPIAHFFAPQLTESTSIPVLLTVSDNQGTQSTDAVVVLVKNISLSPVALAGPDIRVNQGEQFTLSGSSSFDPERAELSYQWSQIQGPAVSCSDSQAATISCSYSATETATVMFELKVSDKDGLSSLDRVLVQPATSSFVPRAVARPVLNISPGAQVTLDASNSYDLDSDYLSYVWRQVDGEEQFIENSSQSQAVVSFASDAAGSYQFEVQVEDETQLLDVQSVIVNVVRTGEDVPVADGGASQYLGVGEIARLNGLASSDTSGGIQTYQWRVIRQIGPNALDFNPRVVSQTIQLPSTSGQWKFELMVSDSQGYRDVEHVIVSTQSNRILTVPGFVNLSVGAQQAVSVNLNQLIPSNSSITWEQIEGTKLELSNTDDFVPTLDTRAIQNSGSIKLRLQVEEAEGWEYSKDLVINVVPAGVQVPLASAGTTQTVTERTLLSHSPAVVSTGIKYSWNQLYGPTVLLNSSKFPTLEFLTPRLRSNQQSSELGFELIASATNGIQAKDRLSVVVSKSTSASRFGSDVLELIRPVKFKQQLGIKDLDDSNASLLSARQLSIDSEENSELASNAPSLLGGDLVEFSVKTAGMSSASVTVHLEETVPEGFVWWKYSRTRKQWLQFPNELAQFSADRKSVTLTILDNSDFDDSPNVGEISDPSGPGAPSSTPGGGSGGGGCFIATATYGDLQDPSVQALCEFRDAVLLKSELGRSFVDLYYHYSPAPAKWLSQRNWARILVKPLLDFLVLGIQIPLLAALTLLLLLTLPFVVLKFYKRNRFQKP